MGLCRRVGPRLFFFFLFLETLNGVETLGSPGRGTGCIVWKGFMTTAPCRSPGLPKGRKPRLTARRWPPRRIGASIHDGT